MSDATFYGLALATLPGLVMTPRPATEHVRAAIGFLGDATASVAAVPARSPRSRASRPRGRAARGGVRPGDGLEAYRRLLAASAERLTPAGSLVIQLRRRVLVAGRAQLGELRTRLDAEGRRGTPR
jgi:hypothetical protein